MAQAVPPSPFPPCLKATWHNQSRFCYSLPSPSSEDFVVGAIYPLGIPWEGRMYLFAHFRITPAKQTRAWDQHEVAHVMHPGITSAKCEEPDLLAYPAHSWRDLNFPQRWMFICLL